MKYSYTFKLNKKDLWLYYMTDRYSSFAGFIQLVFIVSVVLLITARWNSLGTMQPLAVLALLLFMVLQPLSFYINALKSIDPYAPETLIDFSGDEMTVTVQNHIQHIKYKDIVQVISSPFMLVIQADQTHLYILTNRVLGKTKKELYKFLKSNI